MNFRKLYSPHSIILINTIVFVIIFYWFYPFDFFYLFWDQGFYFFKNKSDFTQIFYPYIDNLIYPGFDNPSPLSWVYIASIHYFFTKLFSYEIAQFFYVLITILIAANGYYFFLKKLSKYFNLDEKLIVFFSLGFCFFHYHSFYSLGDFGPNYLFYAFLPITLIFYIEFITKKRSLFFFTLAIILQSQSFTLPVYFINLLLYLILVSVLFINKSNYINICIRSISLIFILLLVLSFYLVNTIIGSTEYLNNQISNVGGQNFLKGFINLSNFKKIILFQNYDLLTNKLFLSYGSWVYFYKSIYFQILILFFYLYLILKIMHLKIKINVIVFYALLLLVSIAPLHLYFISEFLINKFNFLMMYRGWSQKISHFYEFSFLFLTYFILNNKKNNDNLFKLFSLIILIVLTFSTVLGNFLYKKENIKYAEMYEADNVFIKNVSSRVYLEDDMRDLINLKLPENSNIFILPRINILSIDDNKNKNIYFNFYNRLLGSATSVSYGGQPGVNQKLINKLEELNDFEEIITELGKWNFTHIMMIKNHVNNDYFTNKFKLNENLKFLDYLKNNFKVILKNNKYEVYQIKSQNQKVIGKNLKYKRINSLLYILNNKTSDLITLKANYSNKWYALKLSNNYIGDTSENNLTNNLLREKLAFYIDILTSKLKYKSIKLNDNLTNNFYLYEGQFVLVNLKLLIYFASILISIFSLIIIMFREIFIKLKYDDN